MDNPRLSDLTLEELLALLRSEMRDIAREAVREVIDETPPVRKRSPLDLPKLDIQWPSGVDLISREEY